MMALMVRAADKNLARKQDRTPEEEDMLDMMQSGSDRVPFKNLDAVLHWYRT